METILQISGIVLCFFSGPAIVRNWYLAVSWKFFPHRETAPMIPFAGLFAAISILLLPLDIRFYVFWFPVIADPGTFGIATSLVRGDES